MTGKTHNSTIIVHADGSTLTNPGRGAWASITVKKEGSKKVYERILTRVYKQTTNNRMELLGIIETLEYIIKHNESKNSEIKAVSDSKYVIRSASEWIEGWKRNNWRSSSGKSVKNKDLMIRIDRIKRTIPNIVFIWTRGHADNIQNNRCDLIARNEAKNLKRKAIIDKLYEEPYQDIQTQEGILEI